MSQCRLVPVPKPDVDERHGNEHGQSYRFKKWQIFLRPDVVEKECRHQKCKRKSTGDAFLHAQVRHARLSRDSHFTLELAVSAGSEIIVTYNKVDFQGVEQFGIRVLTAQEFLQEIGELP